ncbi:MAG TPA: hypothetical protein VFI29_19020 [Hanamia sp.]|nr:hypothetical protein [Hanamia sp.]
MKQRKTGKRNDPGVPFREDTNRGKWNDPGVPFREDTNRGK